MLLIYDENFKVLEILLLDLCLNTKIDLLKVSFTKMFTIIIRFFGSFFSFPKELLRVEKIETLK